MVIIKFHPIVMFEICWSLPLNINYTGLCYQKNYGHKHNFVTIGNFHPSLTFERYGARPLDT